MSTTTLFDLPYDIILLIGEYLDTADTVSFYLYSRLAHQEALKGKEVAGDILLRSEPMEKIMEAYHGWQRNNYKNTGSIGNWLAADCKTPWLQPYLASARLLVQKADRLLEASALLLQKMPAVQELGAFEPSDTLNSLSKINPTVLELLPKNILLEKIFHENISFACYERLITDYKSPLIVPGEIQYCNKQYKRNCGIQQNPYLMKHIRERILARVKRSPHKNLHPFYMMLITGRTLPGYFDLEVFKKVCADPCMPLQCLLKQMINLTNYVYTYTWEQDRLRKPEKKEALGNNIKTINNLLRIVYAEALFDKDVGEIYDILRNDLSLRKFQAHQVMEVAAKA
jgi:hypothetical protein